MGNPHSRWFDSGFLSSAAALRSPIDQQRRKHRPTRRFFLLGSASMNLLQQPAHSLAQRTTNLRPDTVASNVKGSVSSR